MIKTLFEALQELRSLSTNGATFLLCCNENNMYSIYEEPYRYLGQTSLRKIISSTCKEELLDLLDEADCKHKEVDDVYSIFPLVYAQ